MNKRVIFIHRWDGIPDSDWYPFLKKELSKRGYEALILRMPETDYPKIENWVPKLKEATGEINENTILIGHSMGSQTIMRFLETLPEGQKVGRVIFVAGFITLMGLTEEEKVVAKPWLETPIDLKKVKSKADSFVAIFSDNDPFVPLEENKRVFEENLGAKVMVQHSMGHFTQNDGVTELPVLLGLV
ncbi:alpha/beta hydrolase [Candidatus Daviesbacteria bacterium]|nr:alpha/beta hydrolase [Candidatus Daviesbacteria bacterium]